jgi:hypothetical protein
MLREKGISYIVSGKSSSDLANAVNQLGEHFEIRNLSSRESRVSIAAKSKNARLPRCCCAVIRRHFYIIMSDLLRQMPAEGRCRVDPSIKHCLL